MDNIFVSTGHKMKFESFIRAENCYLYDADGIKYIDLESGIWTTSLGHCHPKITEIIAEQSKKMIHSGFCYLNPIMHESAASILRITGIHSGKCVFLCSGSEAVEYSIKMTKSFSDKTYFLTMKNSYLSAFGISGERFESDWIEFDWLSGHDINAIDFTKISAFVFEPGSSSGLVHFPPKELIAKIVQKVRENGGLIIANEVTTGVGRTGAWFGYNHYGLSPDVVAMGKGLGNGYPVSCVVISNHVLDRLDAGHFHYSQSHQNDPLGAAIAKQVIEIIEQDNLLHKCRETGKGIYWRIKQIQQKCGIIKEIRARGLMIAVEFERTKDFSYAEKIYAELLKKNIILSLRRGMEVLRIDPALTIDKEDIDYFLDCLEEIVTSF